MNNMDNSFNDNMMGNEGTPPIEKHHDLLRELTNFSGYMRDTVNNWLGLAWDEQADSYTRNKLIIPIMNMQGAMWCIGFLKTYTRGNIIITDISSDEYKWIMVDVIDTIWLGIGIHAERFEIINSADLLRICTELQHAIQLVLLGAEGGRYNKNLLGATYSQNGSINNNNQGIREEADKGFIGKIKKGFFGA